MASANVYCVKVRKNDTPEWVSPMFPKVGFCIEAVKEDAKDLLYLYDHVAIFLDDEMVEELGK